MVSPLTSRTMGDLCLSRLMSDFLHSGASTASCCSSLWSPAWGSPFCVRPCEEPSDRGFGQGYMALVSVTLSFYCVSGLDLSLSIEIQFVCRAHLLLTIAALFVCFHLASQLIWSWNDYQAPKFINNTAWPCLLALSTFPVLLLLKTIVLLF